MPQPKVVGIEQAEVRVEDEKSSAEVVQPKSEIKQSKTGKKVTASKPQNVDDPTETEPDMSQHSSQSDKNQKSIPLMKQYRKSPLNEDSQEDYQPDPKKKLGLRKKPKAKPGALAKVCDKKI